MTIGERIIGFDVGRKRIGLAQSDLLGVLASPVGTYSHEEIIPKVKELRSKSVIKRAVVGWPLSLDGHENKTTDEVQQFINRLRNTFPDLDIITEDERYTSEQAKQSVLDSGVPQKKRRQKGLIDKIAATIILQNYLDYNETD